MAKNVVGLFDNPSEAQAAIGDLETAGFRGDNVTMAQNASSRLSGILEQLGIPEEDATIYLEGVRNGGALVILQQLTDDDAYRAAEILNRHHIVDIDRHGRRYRETTETAGSVSSGQTAATGGRARSGSGASSFYQGGDMVIPIVEEELRVGKHEVERGGVRVETRVGEVPVNEQVTLRDEHVDVQRRRVDRPVEDADLSKVQEGSFEVRERDEQAVVDKQARVVEEVVINKDVEQRTETIQDSVRRTDVDVAELADSGRATRAAETAGSSTTGATRRGTSGSAEDEGMLERGGSKAENALERGTGLDLNRDGDVGRRDPHDNY